MSFRHAILSRLAPVLVATASSVIAVGPAMAAKPTLQAPGELVVSSLTEGATLIIDGKPIGTLPLEDSIILLPGEHLVKITKRGFKDFVGTIAIAPGETFELEMDLLPWAGVVRINSNVDGATVKIDGKVEGVTPFDRDIPAGARVITLSAPGYDDVVRNETFAATQTYDLTIDLVKSEKGPVAGAGGDDEEFYETWWFWTLIGVAGAGAATAAVVAGGGETRPLVPNFSLEIP
jgi:hypothetical protein